MKRTRLRRVSKKNSKKHVNTSLVDQYKATVTTCEIIHLFPGTSLFAQIPLGNVIYRIPRTEKACQVHHICGGAQGADRVDLETNIVYVSEFAHLWCEKYRTDQFFVCARVKLDKGDFSFFSMNSILGLNRPGASCVEYFARKPCVFDWVNPIRESVIRDTEHFVQE